MEIITGFACVLICLLATLGRKQDIFLFLSFRLYRDWEVIRQLWTLYVNSTYVTYGIGVVIASFISLQVLRYILNLYSKDLVVTQDDFPVGPLLFPCRTDHSRMVPKKHSFSYSYFLVGVPIDWRGNSGGMISSGQLEKFEPWYMNVLDVLSFGLGGSGAWWSVNADDYLGRGVAEDGLRGKLRSFLETQGVDPDRYAHAYLLTAARFLGYASNPVSIWHLYSANLELTALVLEVNNTFDERHNYFLEPAVKSPSSSSARYSGTWLKDFYVSVFNSRTGAYSLSALDPLGHLLRSEKTKDSVTATTEKAHVDSTITLSLPLPSTKPMLVARVYSSSPPLDPSTMTIFQKTRFLLTWSWVGFATFPRTVQQAWIIFFRVKMPWVFTPQPRADTISAKASPAQMILEKQFRDFLRHVVQQCHSSITLKYVPAGLVGEDAKEEVMVGNPLGVGDFKWREVEVRILTPLFYSRIIHYHSIHDGLLWERYSGTISLSNPYELKSFDFTSSVPAPKSIYSNLLFSLISFLKKNPKPIEPLGDEVEARDRSESGAEITTFREWLGRPHRAEWLGGGPNHDRKWKSQSQLWLSGMDAFVLADTCACAEAREERVSYAPTVLKLMLAERLGFGFMELLDLEILMLRIFVAWLLARISD